MYFTNKISLGSNLAIIKNFSKLVTTESWVLEGDTYTTEVNHNLGTSDIMVSIFKDSVSMSMNNIEILNSNTIKIYNDTPMNCKVVILGKE